MSRYVQLIMTGPPGASSLKQVLPLLSNVSAEQVDAVLAAYRAKGFDMSHVDSMGDWALLVGRRNG